jgi:AraC-like DNA-binding protein
MMENRLQMSNLPFAQRICGAVGMGASLSRLSQSLYDEAKWMKEEQDATALDAYFEILAACIRGEDIPVQPGSELGWRIRGFIDAHISDPMLGPFEVASAIGISVRHVHRIFSVTGSTLGDYIRSRRLEQCRQDLANPHFDEKTITEIAFSRGFCDAAHFSHAFRKQFGISPRCFRGQTLTHGRRIFNNQDPGDCLRSQSTEFRHSRPN